MLPTMLVRLVSILALAICFGSTAQAVGETPSWFQRDLARKAAWLPRDLRDRGVQATAQARLNALPLDVQQNIEAYEIPRWMIALMPPPSDEIVKQLRFMVDLAGQPAPTLLGQRAEELLIFAGSAQLPTPGDRTTGRSLGAEGCSSAMAHYVMSVLKAESPREMAWLPRAIAESQSSGEIAAFFLKLARSPNSPVRLTRKAQTSWVAADVTPGSLMIARKPGGTHVFAWTRVPAGWNWSPGDKMAIGNTGLSQFGSRMILAQEYVTDDPTEPMHNDHGPINSRSVVYRSGAPAFDDPRTNPYFLKGAEFIAVSFR